MTRFPSLEAGLIDARQAGDCDSGYSCAYTNNSAWAQRNPTIAAGARSERCLSACLATTRG